MTYRQILEAEREGADYDRVYFAFKDLVQMLEQAHETLCEEAAQRSSDPSCCPMCGYSSGMESAADDIGHLLLARNAEEF
jgi:hypothetical protein